VAILAPQGLEYVSAFYAAIKAGTIAVPLFAPELPGHAERLVTALNDSQPVLVLTTTAVRDSVDAFLATMAASQRPHVIAIDEIPESRRPAVRMYLAGYSREDIAELMGWTEAKTRNLLYRGLADLRELLLARGIGPEAI